MDQQLRQKETIQYSTHVHISSDEPSFGLELHFVKITMAY